MERPMREECREGSNVIHCRKIERVRSNVCDWVGEYKAVTNVGPGGRIHGRV